ncbi:MAG TPA: alpha/beta hydrolase [Pseudolysinimonas sp.]|nr:alpha/beta hydrolase [Pseudolysinimonas sp.]
MRNHRNTRGDSERLTFVHGNGVAGPAAWPQQLDAFPASGFLTMPGFGEDEEPVVDFSIWIDRIVDDLDERAVLVAHSYGGIAAVLAAGKARDRITELVLIEPALHALKGTGQAVADDIERLAPVLENARERDLEEFWQEFFPAVIGAPAPPLSSPQARRQARRAQALPPSWSFDLPDDVFDAVSTTIVTSGDNPVYEDIAATLLRRDANHVLIPDHGHRPQDSPTFTQLLLKILER